jgi:hypothetical protein
VDTALTQTLAAGIVVGGALFFLGRRAWYVIGSARRAKTAGASCAESGSCGCASAARPTRGADPDTGGRS